MEIKNQLGQSVVEYILLLAVSVSLVLTVFKSQAFKRIFGDQGVGLQYKIDAEWGYRHAFMKGRMSSERPVPYSSAHEHPSYFSSNGGTHFFGPSDPYQ